MNCYQQRPIALAWAQLAPLLPTRTHGGIFYALFNIHHSEAMAKKKGLFSYQRPNLSVEEVEQVNNQRSPQNLSDWLENNTPFQFKLRGNSFFSAPTRRPMSEETRRGSYNSAVAEYKEGLEAIKRASKTVAGGGNQEALKVDGIED